jgi:hypothetical protein
MKLGLKPSNKTKFSKYGHAIMATCAVLLLGHSQAFAQSNTTPCDPQYMDALEARAWMEAQREIAQNQNLITKPDSVLELTCFNKHLNVLAGQASNMLSETTRWGSIPGLGNESTDVALQDLVLAGLVNYIETNFSHEFIGGRSATPHQAFETEVSAGNYECGVMAMVWNEAKCMNMLQKEDFDGFYDFSWYQTQDPRHLPSTLVACKPPVAGENSVYDFTKAADIAFNQRADLFIAPEDNPNDDLPYLADPLVTFLDFILPIGTGTAKTCADPIYTGIMVTRRGLQEYPDAVCSNPGCYYDFESSKCVDKYLGAIQAP